MAIEIKKYKGIEVTIKPVKYTTHDLEEQIQSLLRSYPDKKSVDGPVKNGSVTIIDFEGFDENGHTFEGGSGEDYELTIGSHSFIEGFEEKMVGMEKGETKELYLTFPDDYQVKKLAGKDVVFVVNVKDIIEKHPASLNDEFVKRLEIPDVSNVSEFMTYMNQYMTYMADQQTKQIKEDAIMDKLLEGVKLDFVQSDVDVALQQQVSRLNSMLRQQGVNLDQYLELTHTSIDDLRNELTKSAQKQVKLQKTLIEIASREHFTATQEEIDEHYADLAKHYNMSLDEIHGVVAPNSITSDILMMKASQIVFDTAKVRYDKKSVN